MSDGRRNMQGLKKTPRILVNAKMRVIKDFYDHKLDDEEAIEATLYKAIEDHPNEDMELVLDRAARPYILAAFE
jgi:hypothetical protein